MRAITKSFHQWQANLCALFLISFLLVWANHTLFNSSSCLLVSVPLSTGKESKVKVEVGSGRQNGTHCHDYRIELLSNRLFHAL